MSCPHCGMQCACAANDTIAHLDERIDQLQAELAWYKVSIEDGGGYLGSLKAENAKLRELIAQCADDFEAAANGAGVNFYQCAVDLRAALLGGE